MSFVVVSFFLSCCTLVGCCQCCWISCFFVVIMMSRTSVDSSHIAVLSLSSGSRKWWLNNVFMDFDAVFINSIYEFIFCQTFCKSRIYDCYEKECMDMKVVSFMQFNNGRCCPPRIFSVGSFLFQFFFSFQFLVRQAAKTNVRTHTLYVLCILSTLRNPLNIPCHCSNKKLVLTATNWSHPQSLVLSCGGGP